MRWVRARTILTITKVPLVTGNQAVGIVGTTTVELDCLSPKPIVRAARIRNRRLVRGADYDIHRARGCDCAAVISGARRECVIARSDAGPGIAIRRSRVFTQFYGTLEELDFSDCAITV